MSIEIADYVISEKYGYGQVFEINTNSRYGTEYCINVYKVRFDNHGIRWVSGLTGVRDKR